MAASSDPDHVTKNRHLGELATKIFISANHHPDFRPHSPAYRPTNSRLEGLMLFVA